MEQNQEGIELMDYLEVLWKKKWLIVIPTLVLMIVAGVISFLITPVYEIDSIIITGKLIPNIYQRESDEILLVFPNEVAEEINQKVYSEDISDELGIEKRNFPNIKAEILDDSDLVRVFLRHKNVNLGKDILEHLIRNVKNKMDERIEMELKAMDVNIAGIKRQIEEKRIDIEIQHIEKNRFQDIINSNRTLLMISKKREEEMLEERQEVKKRIEELENDRKKLFSRKSNQENVLSLLLYSNQVQNNLQYYNNLDSKLSDEKICQEKLNLEIQQSQEQLKILDNKIKKLENSISGLEEKIGLLEEEKQRTKPAKLIKPPTSSLKPVAPNKKLNVAVTGILSLFIFTTLAFLFASVEKKKNEK